MEPVFYPRIYIVLSRPQSTTIVSAHITGKGKGGNKINAFGFDLMLIIKMLVL